MHYIENRIHLFTIKGVYDRVQHRSSARSKVLEMNLFSTISTSAFIRSGVYLQRFSITFTDIVGKSCLNYQFNLRDTIFKVLKALMFSKAHFNPSLFFLHGALSLPFTDL
jgi:hypothetical protein